MNDDLARRYSEFLLSSIPVSKPASGGAEINCRCFYCPDSANPKHAHFYISIPRTNTPSKYYCQLCGESGYVTHNTLLDWNIWDDQIAIDLIEYNKHTSVKSTGSKLKVYRLMNPISRDSDISKFKLDYINKRLGTNYSYQDLIDLKIVLNLKDTLEYNHISKITRDPNIVDQLDINFLGFISIDNAFLNMRRLCDDGLVFKSIDKRYINYNIYGKFDTSQRFYTVPTKIDLYNIPTRIHIAEGPFDILSIYENVRYREPGIYTSIGGSNYLGIVMYMIETFKLPCVEVHIYPDNDNSGSNNKMKYAYYRLKNLNIPTYVHRNVYPGEKDFGVTKDRITEQVINMQEMEIY